MAPLLSFPEDERCLSFEKKKDSVALSEARLVPFRGKTKKPRGFKPMRCCASKEVGHSKPVSQSETLGLRRSGCIIF